MYKQWLLGSFWAVLFPVLTFGQTVTLKGKLTNCNLQQVTLYKHDGIQLKPFANIPLQTDAAGTASFEQAVQLSMTGFYFIGQSEQDYQLVLLGPDPVVTFEGTCGNMKQLKIAAPAHEYYTAVLTRFNQQNQTFQQVLQQHSRERDAAKRKALETQLAELDKQKLGLLTELKQQNNALLYDVFAMQTYLSYQHNAARNQSEPDYFAKSYLAMADFSRDSYNHIPHLLDVTRQYAATLAQIGVDDRSQQLVVNDVLNRFPDGSVAKKSAHAGLMLGFMDKSNTTFSVLAKSFKEQYGAENPAVAQFLDQKLSSMASFVVGGEAPDITQDSPEGQPVSLSQLRGKVVLIDFWASWCGPCRKENPHVKKLYAQYKDEGFEIFGVSLDRTKAAWVGAIEKDGLPWYHVSDLKGWQNEAAQLYGVRSIPHTVLIDAEGKIIARNLRGPSLDAKLKEIFGK